MQAAVDGSMKVEQLWEPRRENEQNFGAQLHKGKFLRKKAFGVCYGKVCFLRLTSREEAEEGGGMKTRRKDIANEIRIWNASFGMHGKKN